MRRVLVVILVLLLVVPSAALALNAIPVKLNALTPMVTAKLSVPGISLAAPKPTVNKDLIGKIKPTLKPMTT